MLLAGMERKAKPSDGGMDLAKAAGLAGEGSDGVPVIFAKSMGNNATHSDRWPVLSGNARGAQSAMVLAKPPVFSRETVDIG